MIDLVPKDKYTVSDVPFHQEAANIEPDSKRGEQH